MRSKTSELEFIDDHDAPEWFATTLYRIERIGSCSRLVFATVKQLPAGHQYLKAVVTVIVPAEAVCAMTLTCARQPVTSESSEADAASRIQ